MLLIPFSIFAQGSLSELRGQRYCELLIAHQNLIKPRIQVFNTVGLNQCPQNLWKKLDTKKIMKQTHSFYVGLNGPRYWMFDEMINSSSVKGKVINFGGINMREAGVLKIKWTDFLNLHKPYKPHQVNRTTTWVYQKGKPIYELISPDHHIYIMQSFSTAKVNQDLSSLNSLNQKLSLPPGWTFQSKILKQDLLVTAKSHQAIVIQDNFLNTYQKITDH